MPDPEKTPEQLAQEAINAASQPEEVAITLATGQVYKGKDYEEVARKIAAAEENASREITRLNNELKEAKEYEPEPEPVRTSEKNGFDGTKYYELLAKDPKAASIYQTQHALAEMLGIAPEEVSNRLQFMQNTTSQAGAHMEISAFHAKHPEFPGGDEAASLILNTVKERGEYPSVRNLEAAYYDLRGEGKIKAVDLNQNFNTPQSPPQVGGTGGGASQNTTFLDNFYNLDTDKMADVLNNLSRQGYK
jgi:DNA-binding Lrp family transcriptional regulator